MSKTKLRGIASQYRAWTESDIDILRCHFESLGSTETAKLLGRSRTSVCRKAVRLGITTGLSNIATEAARLGMSPRSLRVILCSLGLKPEENPWLLKPSDVDSALESRFDHRPDGTSVMRTVCGSSVLIDVNDVQKVYAFAWTTRGSSGGRYVYTGSGGRPIYMHRLILGAKEGQYVDHVDHDTLDNRRANLRLCSQSENARNMVRHVTATSQFKGVSICKQTSRWVATIHTPRKVHLGYFASEFDAAVAYDAAARRMFGSFAQCNFEVAS